MVYQNPFKDCLWLTGHRQSGDIVGPSIEQAGSIEAHTSICLRTFVFPLLVVKGMYHCRNCSCFFPWGLSKWTKKTPFDHHPPPLVPVNSMQSLGRGSFKKVSSQSGATRRVLPADTDGFPIGLAYCLCVCVSSGCLLVDAPRQTERTCVPSFWRLFLVDPPKSRPIWGFLHIWSNAPYQR